MSYYAICSNPDCDYSCSYQSEGIEKFDSVRKSSLSDFAGNISDILPRLGPCPKCGSNFLFLCPHCKDSLFRDPNIRICPECGKNIKSNQII